MSPKRGIKLDQIDEFPEQVGMIGLNMLATGGTEFFGTSRYSIIWGSAQIGSTAANSNGVLSAWPIPIPEPITVDALRINVQTAADALDDVRLGIYQGDGKGGRPATLVVQTVDIAVDSTGVKTPTFTAVLLSPGLYWFAIQGSNIDGSTNPIFRGTGSPDFFPYYSNHDLVNNNFEEHIWSVGGQGATMPSTFPSAGAWIGGSASQGLVYINARVA